MTEEGDDTIGVDAITPQSLPLMLRDPQRRATFYAALAKEQGTHLPLHNRVIDVAPVSACDAEELDAIVDLLLADDPHGLLDDFLWHPNIRPQTLLRVLEAGQGQTGLQHLGGPEEVLLRVAERWPGGEATLTLALCIYGPDPSAEAKFFEFLRRHIHCDWLRTSMKVSQYADKIPRERRDRALRLIEEYESRVGSA